MRHGPSGGDDREDDAVPWHGGDGRGGMDPVTVTVERSVWFPGVAVTVMAMVVEVTGEAAAWSRWWRRSGMARFSGAAVKAGWTAWFLGAVTAWRWLGWIRRHLRGHGKF
jgi:hypothetical protein